MRNRRLYRALSLAVLITLPAALGLWLASSKSNYERTQHLASQKRPPPAVRHHLLPPPKLVPPKVVPAEEFVITPIVPIPDGNPFPALKSPEAYEIRTGDYGGPLKAKHD